MSLSSHLLRTSRIFGRSTNLLARASMAWMSQIWIIAKEKMTNMCLKLARSARSPSHDFPPVSLHIPSVSLAFPSFFPPPDRTRHEPVHLPPPPSPREHLRSRHMTLSKAFAFPRVSFSNHCMTSAFPLFFLTLSYRSNDIPQG